MLWFVPLLWAASGTALLAWLAGRVRREIRPTEQTLRGLHDGLRPALVEVRDEAARLRARFERDA